MGSETMAERIWCYAEEEDSELWRGRCSTREEAISEAPVGLGLMPGDTFWVGEFVRPGAAKYMPSAKDILEMATERSYYDEGLESDPLEASAEGEAELDAFLATWTARHVDPVPFFIPDGDPERHQAPADDAITPEEWGALRSCADDGAPAKEAIFPESVYRDLVERGLMRARMGEAPDGGRAEFYLTTPEGALAAGLQLCKLDVDGKGACARVRGHEDRCMTRDVPHTAAAPRAEGRQ